MRLGGPVFDTANDPKSLVAYHQKYGFSAAYMGRIDDRIKRDELCSAYAEANIMLAEFGAYGINILETNRCASPEELQRNLRAAGVCR